MILSTEYELGNLKLVSEIVLKFDETFWKLLCSYMSSLQVLQQNIGKLFSLEYVRKVVFIL